MLATKLEDAKRDEGFTLIELLVVVIIIGILAAIAIPVFLNQRSNAWARSVESDVRNAAIDVETFFNDGFVYPATVTLDSGNAALGTTPPTAVLIQGSPNVVQLGGTTPGLTYQLSTNVDAYCLNGSHTNISSGGTAVVATYVSNAGGLQATPAACSTFAGFS